MKKLILMLFLVVGGVMSASAAVIYIENADPEHYKVINLYVWKEGGSEAVSWETGISCESTVEKFGTTWYVYNMGDNDRVIVRGNSANWDAVKTYNITVTEDMYFSVSGDGQQWITKRNWHYPRFLNNITSTGWGGEDSKFDGVAEDALTYSKTISKAEIGSNTNIYFRFRAGYDSYFPQIYPQVDNNANQPLSIASSTNSYWQDGYVDGKDWAKDDNNGRTWNITVPSYDFESIKLKAAYRKIDGEWKWTVSADAYISKTVSSDYKYATVGTTVPLDLSVAAALGVTAYTLSANATTGAISKTEKTTALAANEGALLENLTGSDVVLSIPVAASAVADGSNQLKAFTGGASKLAKETVSGSTNYILANQDGHVGFYMVNAEGNNMGANTAYLQVPNAGAARMAFFFDESEATAIQNVEKMQVKGQFFNLNGQRVAQPQKGLYIVNGKKMLMK